MEATRIAAPETQVYFVGAGPGDPKLLTIRAKEVLESVDAVLYDRLVSNEVLNVIPKTVRLIDVGKSPHSRTLTQGEITLLIISLVKNGKTVARLKGGDSLLFSRGSEEATALRRNGISFEIVPGITSAIGATAYAGIPLTHRDYSSSVLIATGHECYDKNKKRIDWRKVPTSSVDTIVLLMGVERFPRIASELIRGGLDPKTPVAAVQWGTTNKQRTTFFTLVQGKVAGASLLQSPSVIVVGSVVSLAEQLGWWMENDQSSANMITPPRENTG